MLLGSFLNHSCDANVMMVDHLTHSREIPFVASAPIKKGKPFNELSRIQNIKLISFQDKSYSGAMLEKEWMETQEEEYFSYNINLPVNALAARLRLVTKLLLSPVEALLLHNKTKKRIISTLL